MDKEWVEARKAKAKEEFECKKKDISQKIIDFGKFAKNYETELLNRIDALKFDKEEYKRATELDADIRYDVLHVANEDYMDYLQFAKHVDSDDLRYLIEFDYDKYADSEPVYFDGDIIITDPCYIMRAEHHGTEPITEDDWDACDYGSSMEVLGIRKYMTRDTLYGDWSCTTYNTDTKESIGKFCADAGLVSVIDLNEVLAYNPDFDYHIKRPCTTTLIKDFKGIVQFVVRCPEEVCENTTGSYKAGDIFEEFEVVVIGHGVNKVTGEPINFEGRQTGF